VCWPCSPWSRTTRNLRRPRGALAVRRALAAALAHAYSDPRRIVRPPLLRQTAYYSCTSSPRSPRIHRYTVGTTSPSAMGPVPDVDTRRGIVTLAKMQIRRLRAGRHQPSSLPPPEKKKMSGAGPEGSGNVPGLRGDRDRPLAPPDEGLICCELARTMQRSPNTDQAGLDERVEFQIGTGSRHPGRCIPRTVRLRVIDARRTEYSNYFEEVLPRTRPNGLIMLDNTPRRRRPRAPRPEAARVHVRLNDRPRLISG